jgi:hypothetical protein
MRRKLSKLLALFCLVLVFGCAAAWWRSWIYADNLELSSGPRPVIFCSGEGRLGLLRFGTVLVGERFSHTSFRRGRTGSSFLQYMTEQPESHNLLRFAVGRGASGNLGGEWWVGVPYWFLIILFTAFPLMRTMCLTRRIRRQRAGCCLACGYDLRGTPDHCPECGAIPPAESPRMA